MKKLFSYLLTLLLFLVGVALAQSDNPCGAPALTVGTGCTFTSGSIVGFTNTTGVPAPGCASYSGPDGWYTVTVPASGRIILDSNTGTITDFGMAIYSGTCSSLSLIECDDDDSPNGLMSFIDRSGLTPGSTIWVRVWRYGGGTGTYSICAYTIAPPTCPSGFGTSLVTIPSLPQNYTSQTTCGTGNNVTSTNVTTVCGSANYYGGEDRTYTFTPLTTGSMTISLTSSSTWVGIMLYQGCPFSGGTCVSVSQSSLGNQSITPCVTAGVQYYLIVDAYPAPTCHPSYSISFSAVTPPGSCTSLLGTGIVNVPALPYNSTGRTTCGRVNDLTDVNVLPVCGSTSYYTGEDEVFVFTPATSGSVTFTLNSATTYTGMMLYDGCPRSTCSTPSNCVGNIQSAGSGIKTFTACLAAGVTYYLIVDTWSSPSCIPTYSIDISAPVGPGAPANDLPCAAIPLTIGAYMNGTNACSGAAGEPGNPGCWTTGNVNTVWYSFVATDAAMKIRTKANTIIDPQIAVYSGSCSSLSLVTGGCNTDGPGCGAATVKDAEVSLTGLTIGATYWVRIDGQGDNTGTFGLIVVPASSTYPPAPGQDCGQPIPVCAANISIGDPGFQAIGATCDLDPSVTCLGTGEQGSVWYTFRTNGAGNISFIITPNDGTTDYDFALWDITGVANPCNTIKTNTAPTATSTSSGSNVAGGGCNYSAIGLTGMSNTPPSGCACNPAFPVGAAPRTFMLLIQNFSNSTSGFNINFGSSPIDYTWQPPISFVAWTGGAGNTDWFNANNWGGCIPTCARNVVITPASANQPVINAPGAVCRDLTINSGASLTINSTRNLDVCGNWQNNGIFDAKPGSSVTFIGNNNNQTLDGNMIGLAKFANLIINKTGTPNTVSQLDNVEVEENFTISSGNYTPNALSLFVGGNFTNNSTFTPGTSTVIFDGATGSPVYTKGAAAVGDFYNVTMNGSAGISLSAAPATNMIISNVLTLTNGIITTGANQVRATSTAAGAVTVGNVNSYVNGFLRRRVVPSTGYEFPVGHLASGKGYQRSTISFGGGSATGTGANLADYLVANFNPTPLAPTPSILPVCASANVPRPQLDNGHWVINAFNSSNTQITATGIMNYSATVYPLNYTNPFPYATLGRNSSIAMGTATCGSGSSTSHTRNNLTGFSDFSVLQGEEVFPVELMDFAATNVENKSVALVWKSAVESNLERYEIERSLDATNFYYMDKVGARGSNSVYQLVDNNPMALNTPLYYRLRMVDADGSFKYSNVVEVVLSTSGYVVRLLPNPIKLNQQSSLEISGFSGRSVEVTILDIQGRKLLHKNIAVVDGKGQLSIDAAGWSAGVYSVHVGNDRQAQWLRFVIE